MTLPTVDYDKLAAERPGDQLFQEIKHYLPFITKRANKQKKHLVSLILSDMVHAFALAEALDEVGMVIEYHCQQEGIERPKFDGDTLMERAGRLAYLRFITGYAKLLGFEPERIDVLLQAEIDNQYREPRAKQQVFSPKLQMPEEFYTQMKQVAQKTYEQAKKEPREPKPKREPKSRTTSSRPRKPRSPAP